MRSILSLAVLLAVGIWIGLSYLSPTFIVLPTVAFPTTWLNAIFPWLLALSAVIFVLIQLELLRSTVDLFRPKTDGSRPAAQEASVDVQPTATAEFGLNLATEFFWTAIPLVVTLVLALLIYQLWTT